MPGPKFSKTQREEVRDTVAKLDRAGYHQHDIVRKLAEQGVNISQVMVCKHLKTIRSRYIADQLDCQEHKTGEHVAKLRDIRVEALEAWNLSRERVVDDLAFQVIRQVRAAASKNLPIPDHFTLTLKADPANEFLRTVLECDREERKLLGLYAETGTGEGTKVNVNVHQGVVVSMAQLTGDEPDEVEAAIANVAPAQVTVVPIESLPIGLKELGVPSSELPTNGQQPSNGEAHAIDQ